MRLYRSGPFVALLAALLAGCSGPSAGASASATAAPSTEAPVTTSPFTTAEANFLGRIQALGIHFGGGQADTVQLGAAICAQLRSEVRPAQTLQELQGRGLSAQLAQYVYKAANETMCPGYSPPDPNTFGDGTYEVGVDIQPGKYKSPGGNGCYWARLDRVQQIIDNDLSDGPTVVTVQKTDGYLKLSNCTWTKTP